MPEREWELYTVAIQALRKFGISFMLGGGFAFAAYTGRWRDTKDIDFYIEPGDRDAAAEALGSVGFEDYYRELPYDRKWIYRSTRSGVIVDIIWAMANQRARVDKSWFAHAPELTIRGVKLPVVAIEEMIWCKLYILQRDRCDWTDIINLVFGAGPQLNWNRLIRLLAGETALLGAMLRVYGWLAPLAARKLPAQLWHRLRVPQPSPRSGTPEAVRQRAALLDSRGWFAGVQPADQKLEI